MNRFFITIAACLAATAPASAFPDFFPICTRSTVERLNRTLAGRVLDYTNNHGSDRRIWSPALGEKRDVYVYVPPGYDGVRSFPVVVWMHGFQQDERTFLELAGGFDRRIRCGELPPLILVGPDGSVAGRPKLRNSGSFFVNSNAGRFEDYLVCDVWGFVVKNFAVHPDRRAHVLAGGSMGGYAAYHLGFKHRETFGVLIGVMPPLDVRYADCHDNYLADYDPNCHRYRTEMHPRRVIARMLGVIPIRERNLTAHTVGALNPDGMAIYSLQNPVEMLDRLAIRPGEFEMFVGYAGKDEFNLDAQAEHFLDVARRRGIEVAVKRVHDGRHSVETGKRLVPDLLQWLAPRLSRFTPSAPPPPAAEVAPAGLLVTVPTLELFRVRPAAGLSATLP